MISFCRSCADLQTWEPTRRWRVWSLNLISQWSKHERHVCLIIMNIVGSMRPSNEVRPTMLRSEHEDHPLFHWYRHSKILRWTSKTCWLQLHYTMCYRVCNASSISQAWCRTNSVPESSSRDPHAWEPYLCSGICVRDEIQQWFSISIDPVPDVIWRSHSF